MEFFFHIWPWLEVRSFVYGLFSGLIRISYSIFILKCFSFKIVFINELLIDSIALINRLNRSYLSFKSKSNRISDDDRQNQTSYIFYTAFNIHIKRRNLIIIVFDGFLILTVNKFDKLLKTKVNWQQERESERKQEIVSTAQIWGFLTFVFDDLMNNLDIKLSSSSNKKSLKYNCHLHSINFCIEYI